MDSEVFYDAMGEVARRLREIDGTLEELTSERRLVLFLASQFMTGYGLNCARGTDHREGDRWNAVRALEAAEMLVSVYEHRENERKERAKEARRKPSNSGPLVGDESVYLGDEPEVIDQPEDE